MKKTEIPKQVTELAKTLGYEITKPIKIDNKTYFAPIMRGEYPMPTGLPTLIDFNGSRAYELETDEVFKLLSELRKMNDNPLKLCRYYHGEEECPYKSGSKEETFWIYERFFFVKTERVHLGVDYWKKHYKETASYYKDVEPFLIYSKLPVETKALIAYMREDLGHMSPDWGNECVKEYIPKEEAAPMLEKCRKANILKGCKFYKGEKKCPYNDFRRTYWDLEEFYVKHVIDDEIRRTEYGNNLTILYKYNVDYIDVPFYLKATMYDRYYHWCGGDAGFEDWLLAYANCKEEL